VWEYRAHALNALEGALSREAAIVDGGFSLIDVIIKRLAAHQTENAYAQTYALILVKVKHFGQACFSLALDGLAQESGALLRTWIESLELLRYLNTDPQPPKRFERIWQSKLPSAGEIAKKIGGHFQPLRNMLSDTASHFKMRPESLRHVLDAHTGEVKGEQIFSEGVVRTNLATCSYFLYFSAVEAVVAAGVAGVPNEDLGHQLDAWFAAAEQVFPTSPAA
jgi:hypothetical protein